MSATDDPTTRSSAIQCIRADLEGVSQTRTSGPGGMLSLYGLLCLSLAFLVFAWGTNYKLSLYNAGHQNSPAKVCTRGSDPAKNALDHVAGGSAVVHTALIANSVQDHAGSR
jgi:hypothetical protein